MIDLAERVAWCAYCRAEQPSSRDLAFFEYLGSGSREAEKLCKNCGFYDSVHDEANPAYERSCKGFEPRGDVGHDRYYCGCRGWD